MDVAGAGRKRRNFLAGCLVLLLLAGGFIFLASILPFSKGSGSISLGGDRIAVVEVFGVISDASEIITQIKEYAGDSSIKGILIHIDSPGGAVAPSQEIYNAVLEARKKKKVVASMATLAASGGYYIAVGAERIVANPGTITGSIGVIMGFVDMRDLFSKLGLKAITVKSGKFKDIGSGTREFTEEDRQVLQAVIDDVYGQFVEAVAKGRNMDVEEVKKLADGRIYSGRQSYELGMVDQLGGYDDAVKLLAEMAGIRGEPVIVKEEEGFRFFKELLSEKLDWFFQGLGRYRPGLYYIWPSTSF